MRGVIWFSRASLIVALLALAAVAVSQADDKDKKADKDKDKKVEKDKDKDKVEEREPDVVYVPTPQEVVDKMLEVAKVTEKDVVYDLGCGDGRIVCTAAKKYKCRAMGVDIDPERIADSEKTKAALDKEAQKLVTFKKQDLFTLDVSEASVVTLYLLPDLNVKLLPQLKKLKNGSRIVSHSFDIKGVLPDKGYPIVVKTKDGLEHDVFLYTLPLTLEKDREEKKDDKKDKDKDKKEEKKEKE